MNFLDRPAVRRDQIGLPDDLLENIERQVLGIGRHSRRLLASGQHLKRGILLHGAPGTGKTHTVRYLLSQLPDVTVIVISGQALGRIREPRRGDLPEPVVDRSARVPAHAGLVVLGLHREIHRLENQARRANGAAASAGHALMRPHAARDGYPRFELVVHVVCCATLLVKRLRVPVRSLDAARLSAGGMGMSPAG
jgi:hypothetical protein